MAYGTTTTETDTPALGVRVALALLGAGGMIVGAFLAWTNSTAGTKIGIRALWTTSPAGASDFFSSVGVVMIALGLIAILSLVSRSGWLTRLAGVLGIIAIVLFAIEVYRSATLGSLEVGAWVSAVGALLVLLAGLFAGSRTTVVTPPAPPPYTPPR